MNNIFTKDVIFIPAISISTHLTILQKNYLIDNKSPRFYLRNDKPIFKHDYILIESFHNLKNKDFSKSIGINSKDDTNMIFCDSGGFQIKFGVFKDYEGLRSNIYDWLIQNATIAPIIDVPTSFATPKGNNITTEEYNKCLNNTCGNIEYLLDNKKDKEKVLWLNCSHGRSYEQRKKWYDRVKDYPLNGWGVGSASNSFYSILVPICLFLEEKVFENKECKHIHIFGKTSTRFIPLFAYLKHKMNKLGIEINFSFDSSYATQNGGWGKYLTFEGANGFVSYHLSNKFIDQFKDTPLPCYCPVCEGKTMSDILNKKALTKEGEYFFYNIVQNHNLFVLKKYVEKIQNIIFTDHPDMMQSALPARYINLFKVIDKIFDAKNNYHQVLIDNFNAISKCDIDTDDSTDDINDLFESI